MSKDIAAILLDINVDDYLIEIPVTGDWVSYRYIPSPFTASKKEARYNKSGEDAFYLADSKETAEHEIRFNYDEKELYRVKPSNIIAFDAYKFAEDYSLTHPLTSAQEEGSYEFCQEIAGYLTQSKNLSGVYYPSRQRAVNEETGNCIVLLPKPHQLMSGTLQIFQK
jgi:RES domain-containing protein